MDATLFLNGKPWHVTGSVIEKYSPNVAMCICCDRNAVHVHLDNPADLSRLGEQIIKLAKAMQRDLNPPLVHSSQAPVLSEIDETS